MSSRYFWLMFIWKVLFFYIFISPEIATKVTCTWPRELSYPWVITMFRKVTFINEIYIADTQRWWKSAASDILGVTLRNINTYANLYYFANSFFFFFISPGSLFLLFIIVHLFLSLSLSRTLASLRFLEYVSCVVGFILGLGTTPLPFTNTARLWKESSPWQAFSLHPSR